MFKLIDKQLRSKLGEGRDQGMGFALCKREGNTVTTVNPISPCKDYLNDVVYSEMTGKPYRAHGLQTKKNDIFNGDMAYMVAAICKQGCRGQYEYDGYSDDVKAFADNLANIHLYLNKVEDLLKLKQRTALHQLPDGIVLVIFPKFWVNATYKISLYTLLMRAALRWDGKTDVFDAKGLSSEDIYMLNDALPKLKKMVNGVIPVQDFTSCDGGWHNEGIVSFNFPNE